jgi:hypothetical protein
MDQDDDDDHDDDSERDPNERRFGEPKPGKIKFRVLVTSAPPSYAQM